MLIKAKKFQQFYMPYLPNSNEKLQKELEHLSNLKRDFSSIPILCKILGIKCSLLLQELREKIANIEEPNVKLNV